MRTLASLITAASTILPLMTVVQYEARTGLHDNWTRNRAFIEQRVTLNQTNMDTGETNERAVTANLREIQQYSDAYLCATKQDVKRCKTGL